MSRAWRDILDALGQVNGRAWLNAALNYGEKLLRIPTPRSMPVSLDVILTKACNLRCVFCISYSSVTGDRWMPFELYEQVAARLFPTAHNVNFCSGGEPFLYPRIRDALALARRHRTKTVVVSNGMALNAATADWVVSDQALHELKISFDGATKETLERIRRGANYDTVLANIARLDRLKRERGVRCPRIGIRYAVMKSNAEELPAMPGLCARHGVERLDVVYLNVTNDMDFGESLYNHPDLAARVFAGAKREGAAQGVRVNLPPLPGQDRHDRRCSKPWHFCQVDADGAIRFCYKAWRQRLGFFQDGFDNVWRGPHYRRIRETVDSGSPYFPYCQFCAVRRGLDWESSHNQKLHEDAYVIPGAEDLQIPFNERREENVTALKQPKA
jgi:MoaA/NifB/PqqE/SkfB family radical SAM enzyme